MFSDKPEDEEEAFASCTLAVNENVPATVGIPAIVPVGAFS
jgi:hypothetical protein